MDLPTRGGANDDDGADGDASDEGGDGANDGGGDGDDDALPVPKPEVLVRTVQRFGFAPPAAKGAGQPRTN